jgi:hypothetical protein
MLIDFDITIAGRGARMKRSEPKKLSFTDKLTESLLFDDLQVVDIALRCGKDQTITNIMVVCDDLGIYLTKDDVEILCGMDFKV